jgi:ferric-dicitrate binding protein FerR (iron transport regulator)
VGTWFNVALIDGGARVAVVEGRVAIVGAASKGAIEIGEGERAWLTSFGQAERLQPDALLDAHAQVQRSVRYVKGTLADLVDVFNAHNRLPRFIVEGGARAIKVSTTLDLDNPRTLIAALEGDTRVTLVRVGDSIVIRESRRRTDGRGKKIAALSPFIGWRNAFSTGYVSRTTEFVAWQ